MKGLKLMAVLAHADERALAADGALARWAAEGAETHLVIAAVGSADRRAFVEASVRAGVRQSYMLSYPGERLDAIAPATMVQRLAEQIRHLRPEILVTHPGDAWRQDPDSAAMAEAAEAALVAAADPAYRVPSGSAPHRVWIVDAPEVRAPARALVA